MDYKLIYDDKGLVSDILVNGKPVKRRFMRGFKKAQSCSYFALVPDFDFVFRNPSSGAEVKLNGFEGCIYVFCREWYWRYKRGIAPQAPIQAYDDMKYFLLFLNPQAYMDLLD